MGTKTLNQMLAERKMPERIVKVCLRADVAADIEQREAEIRRLQEEAEGDARLAGDPRLDELGEQIADLEKVAAEYTIEVRVRALKHSKWKQLVNASVKINPETGKEEDTDLDKLMETAIPLSIVEPEMSQAEMADLLEGLTDGQFGDFYRAVWELNRHGVAVPKSVLGSQARQTSSERQRLDGRLA